MIQNGAFIYSEGLCAVKEFKSRGMWISFGRMRGLGWDRESGRDGMSGKEEQNKS